MGIVHGDDSASDDGEKMMELTVRLTSVRLMVTRVMMTMTGMQLLLLERLWLLLE